MHKHKESHVGEHKRFDSAPPAGETDGACQAERQEGRHSARLHNYNMSRG